MKILVSIFLMVLVIVLAGAGVWADGGEGHVCFTEVDTNGDEKVTPGEYEKVYGSKGLPFAKGDENSDGYIDHDEYENMMDGSS